LLLKGKKKKYKEEWITSGTNNTNIT
jgi:hypothetical protein